MTNQLETATLGAGCFWCVEAVFDELKGVEDVVSGYSGGHTKNPTYKQVCSETTGHAEVVQIKFNSEELPFADLLRVFFTVHDPTQLNRQGNDVGESYRSAIFFHDDNQEKIAHQIKQEIEDLGIYGREIVTEITPFTSFYEAEEYLQEYFANNPVQPYCMGVVAPKVAKFRKTWREKLKK